MANTVAALITLYQRFFSPILHQLALMPGGCRFTPSCSAYGAAALRQYGLVDGSVLLFRRLGRCHPLAAGGFDPLPPARRMRDGHLEPSR